MNDKQVKALLDGGIGYFWINNKGIKKVSRANERGFLRKNDAGLIEVTTLDEGDYFDFNPQPAIPKSITGITEHGGVLLLAVRGARPTKVIGGAKASVHRYRAWALITGPHPAELKSDRVSSLTLLIPSIGDWTGLSAMTTRVQTSASTSMPEALTLELRSPADLVASLGGGLELAIGKHWETSGEMERRLVNTPTTVTVRSARPRRVDDLRLALHWIHGLLCIAHEGCVVAESGHAVPDTIEPMLAKPRYWDLRFMERPQAAPTPDLQRPVFNLGVIGGPDGVRRWLQLCKQHPRAVLPLIEPYATGPRSASVRMLESAAAIEYWVSSNNRTAAWAKKSGKWHSPRQGRRGGSEPVPARLAHHVGADFGNWVGDINVWADQYWETYNALKHDPNATIDLGEAAVLAESGMLLLTSALLNRIARSKAPSKMIFGENGRTYRLREAVRQVIT